MCRYVVFVVRLGPGAASIGDRLVVHFFNAVKHLSQKEGTGTGLSAASLACIHRSFEMNELSLPWRCSGLDHACQP